MTNPNNKPRTHWRRTALLMAAAVGVVVYAVPEAERSVLLVIAIWPFIHQFGRDDDPDDTTGRDDDPDDTEGH